MSKRNYNRVQSSSFAPRFSGQSESDRQESIMTRMGKGKYYALKGQAAKAERQHDTENYRTEYLERQKLVKRKKDRLEMMLEMKRLKEL
jgi:hypothetical protein